MHMSQRKLVTAVKREFARVKADVEPKLLADPRPEVQSEQFRNLQYAQNTLRTCMEATLTQMVPYTHETSVELAIRLASYALSIVPQEDQDLVMAQFMKSFVFAHETRVAKGIVISTEWQMEDGRSQPNYPEGRK